MFLHTRRGGQFFIAIGVTGRIRCGEVGFLLFISFNVRPVALQCKLRHSYCPECGLPLSYVRSKDVYVCDSSYPVVSLEGCGFIIIASDVDEI